MKWGGAVVTVLLVGVWIGSGWCAFVCPLGPRHVLAVERGTLALRGFSADHAFKFGFYGNPPYFHEPPKQDLVWYTSTAGSTRLIVATLRSRSEDLDVLLWALLLGAAITSVLAWRLDVLAKRSRFSFCAKCGYHRAGLAAGAVCPECGTAAPPAAARF